ncbi:hypothetical protein STTU_3840 [Streptomyces sp. Tu6071]|nr:hypothetical protein STTU_3840 [Streptomyces sp. Tu6071]
MVRGDLPYECGAFAGYACGTFSGTRTGRPAPSAARPGRPVHVKPYVYVALYTYIENYRLAEAIRRGGPPKASAHRRGHRRGPLRLGRDASRCLPLPTPGGRGDPVLHVHDGVRHESAHRVVPDQVPQPGARGAPLVAGIEVLAEAHRVREGRERGRTRVRWHAGADRRVEPGPDLPARRRLRGLVARRRQHPAHLARDGGDHADALQVREIRLTQPETWPTDPVDRAHRGATPAQQLKRVVQGRITGRPRYDHGDPVPVRGYPSGQRQLH